MYGCVSACTYKRRNENDIFSVETELIEKQKLQIGFRFHKYNYNFNKLFRLVS